MERELWEQLYRMVVRLDTFWTNGLYRTWEIVIVYLWAVVHDRPISWACDPSNWGSNPLPRLPSQATMSRRSRRPAVGQLLKRVEAELVGDPRRWWLMRIDSKPLPIGTHSKDPDAKLGRAGKGFARGYKLHAIWGGSPLPSVWCMEPMNAGDATVARHLVGELPGEGYIVGDSQYDSNPLHRVASPRHQVIARQKRPNSQGLGHRRHHPARLRALELIAKPFGRALLHYRDQIERDFGNLTSFAAGLGPLPSWIRRIHRVRLWVQAKLLLNAQRIINSRPLPLPAPA